MIRTFFLFILVGIQIGFTSAQSISKKVKVGNQYFENEYYVLALEAYHKVLKEDSSQADIKLLASICYLELDEPEKAFDLLNSIENENYSIRFFRAASLYKMENFDESLSLLNSLPDSISDPYLDPEKLKEQIRFAKVNYEDSKGFVVRNFGEKINTPHREYSSVMINQYDSVLFTSRPMQNHSLFEADGMGYENIFLTSLDTADEWLSPEKFQINVQSEKSHDATVQIFDQGKSMIFFHNGDLFLSRKENNKWTRQEELKSINTLENETHCFITDDEKTIYFSSDFLSEDGNLDLFATHLQENGKWTEPGPIEELNTPFDEDSPFISQDGTFYFSSRGHNSMGGYDVFSTSYDDKSGKWAPVKNLGHPINTVADDIFFNTYGKLGYISSSRKEGFGSLDLYRFFLFNRIKMTGRILSSTDRTPIPGATIDFEYGPWFLRGYSDINGNYEMSVPINKNMKITVEKDSIVIHKGNYHVKVFFDDVDNNRYDFVVDVNTLDQPVPSLKTDPGVSSDTVAIKLFVKNDLKENMLLSSVDRKHEEEWGDSINNFYYNQWQADRKLNLQGILNDEAIVYFDCNQHKLNVESEKKLSEIAMELKKQNGWILEIAGHTDIQGGEKYNMRLSLKRSQEVYQYLLNQNISGEQMIMKGFGEMKPKFDEDNELAYSKNRRVELQVIE